MIRARYLLSKHGGAVFLTVLVVALSGASYAGIVHQEAVQQAAQRRQGAQIEKALCADLGTMAAIRPPAGNPKTNPSRAYEQDEHRAWAGLTRDLGCQR